jgi:predicted Zn finger-like uncharacterized protein
MTMQIICPSCQTTYNIADAQADKKVRCKKCQTVFQAVALPVAEVEPPEDAPRRTKPRAEPEREEERVTRRKRSDAPAAPARSRSRHDRDYDDDDVVEVRRRRSKSKRSTISTGAILLVVGGVCGSLLVVAVSIGFVVWLWNQDSKQDSAQNSNPVPVMRRQAAVQQIGGDPGGDEREADEKEPAQRRPGDREPPPLPPAPRLLEFLSPLPKEVAAASAPAAPANVELAADVLQKVKRATVYLRVTMANGQVASGSGFFGVEPNIVLTNAHVVGMLQPENDKPRHIEAVQNSGTGEERHFPAELLGVDRTADLAVLRVAVKNTPQPLEVKGARNLRETQRVWVVGFPLGEQLGKEITVSESSVSSLRKDDNGAPVRVQVNGGMHHGNSGGPVVDVYGNVVGVAVSGIAGTQLNFAVPGEAVHILMNGRVSKATLGQPYLADDGAIRMAVSLQTLDPLKRMDRPSLEFWTGNPSATSRPPLRTKPSAAPGDSPHLQASLEYHDGEAKAEIVLPVLADGKRYWLQPHWRSPAGEELWASGRACDEDDIQPPVEKRGAQLDYKLPEVGGRHDLVLNVWVTTKAISPQQGELTRVDNRQVGFTELTQSIDQREEQANVCLQYQNYNEEERIQNQANPHNASRMARIRNSVHLLKAYVQLDKQGKVVKQTVDFDKVPEKSRSELAGLHNDTESYLDCAVIPLPNRRLNPGDDWHLERRLPLIRQGPFTGDGTIDMTYKLLGVRKRSGREEAVLSVTGLVRGQASAGIHLGGRADGFAVVDLATGQVSQVKTRFTYDQSASVQGQAPIKFSNVLDVRLRRSLSPTTPH